jgi:hypothetical protein
MIYKPVVIDQLGPGAYSDMSMQLFFQEVACSQMGSCSLILWNFLFFFNSKGKKQNTKIPAARVLLLFRLAGLPAGRPFTDNGS